MRVEYIYEKISKNTDTDILLGANYFLRGLLLKYFNNCDLLLDFEKNIFFCPAYFDTLSDIFSINIHTFSLYY